MEVELRYSRDKVNDLLEGWVGGFAMNILATPQEIGAELEIPAQVLWDRLAEYEKTTKAKG
jgi:hypothetical protein